MPLRLPAVELAADAESLRRARSTVRAVLTDLGRLDLLDAALVGTSELVGNAVLHGDPPISIQVRGTRQCPRVEVRDGSRRPPKMTHNPADQDQLLATYGRGLWLVAMVSTAWGADLTTTGKVVWFAPAAEPRLHGDLSGEVFDYEVVLQGPVPPGPRPEGPSEAVRASPGEPIRIRILGLPVAAYAGFRQRYFDLARELRLLSLSDEHPVAQRFSAVFLEAERLGRQVRGLERLDAALSQHGDVADLDLFVPPALPLTMRQLLDTLDQVDELCRHEQMLTLAASSAEQRLIRWWFTEFVRQGDGQPPTSWQDYVDSADD
jgi:anti-sigma regulatory factor (Ser/Thr protein kinase)